MIKILEKNDSNKLTQPLKTGAIVKGEVVEIDRSTIFIDLNRFGTGIVYGKEFYEAKDALKNIKIGSSISTKVIDLDNKNGYIELSLKQASEELNWKRLAEKKDQEEIIKVKILGANKGGLLTRMFDISAFLPVSQLSPKHYPKVEDSSKQKILDELQKFIGEEIDVKILSVDPNLNKLILSEKKKGLKEKKELLEEYKEGDIIEGSITGLVDFGAFIKFPLKAKDEKSIEGLIHISELDWKMINNPGDIVKTGENVKAKIIDISNNKVSLSIKALKENPWDNIDKKYKKGDKIKGKVSRINHFGAFININNEIQGLCHVSEFETKTEMETNMIVGKEYNFEIFSIEPENHKLTLKLINK